MEVNKALTFWNWTKMSAGEHLSPSLLKLDRFINALCDVDFGDMIITLVDDDEV